MSVAADWVKDVRREIDQQYVVDLALRLVSTPSPQTDKMEYEPLVKQFVKETIYNELQSIGVENVIFDEMGNLICRIGYSSAKRKVFYLGYAMTHPASSMKDPFKGEVVKQDGKDAIRGRGISEQKGSLAGMIAAIKYLHEHRSDLDGEMIFAVSLAGETGRHDSIRSIRKAIDLKADFGIVGIGMNGKICQGNKGRVDVLINVYGKSCHSSTPSEGINAVEGASLVIQKLQQLQLKGEHPHLGRPTLAVTSIKSFPDATHTIQNECRLVYDRRLLPGEEAAAAVEEIRNVLGEMPPYRIEVIEGPVTLPSEVEDDSIVITKLAEAIRQVRGQEPEIFYSHGAIDAGYLNKHQIPSVMFGPGQQSQWHTDNEILLVDDLMDGAYIYTCLAMNHLAKNR